MLLLDLNPLDPVREGHQEVVQAWLGRNCHRHTSDGEPRNSDRFRCDAEKRCLSLWRSRLRDEARNATRTLKPGEIEAQPNGTAPQAKPTFARITDAEEAGDIGPRRRLVDRAYEIALGPASLAGEMRRVEIQSRGVPSDAARRALRKTQRPGHSSPRRVGSHRGLKLLVRPSTSVFWP
jgi:hypothetical protein